MGTSSALLLARAGAAVTVLEKAIPGAEASSAAAGILGAEVECDEPGPLLELCRASREIYPAWVRELSKSTGIDVGYAEGGSLELRFDRASLAELGRRRSFQLRMGKALKLGRGPVRELEPELTSDVTGALHFMDDARVTPPLLYRATHIAATRAGVAFLNSVAVERVLVDDRDSKRRVSGVRVGGGTTIEADVVVVAAGSWTPWIEGLPLAKTSVLPARGQIVELETAVPLLDRVVLGSGVYLVPRKDGRLLIGSTLEFVGYKKGVTAGGVRDLLNGAIRLVPNLVHAELSRTWSNFRPYTNDHLPLLGTTSIAGLILASGHYRNGILLAPITAHVVTALALGRKPPLDLAPYDPARSSVAAT